MIRAMVTKREQEVAAVVDGVFTTTGADGKAYAANDHPLDTSKTAAKKTTGSQHHTGCNSTT